MTCLTCRSTREERNVDGEGVRRSPIFPKETYQPNVSDARECNPVGLALRAQRRSRIVSVPWANLRQSVPVAKAPHRREHAMGGTPRGAKAPFEENRDAPEIPHRGE